MIHRDIEQKRREDSVFQDSDDLLPVAPTNFAIAVTVLALIFAVVEDMSATQRQLGDRVDSTLKSIAEKVGADVPVDVPANSEQPGGNSP